MTKVPTLTRVVNSSGFADQSVLQMPVSPVTTGERHLLDLPTHILTEHRAWIGSGLWQGMFDCAIWLRTPQGIPQPLQLQLRYQDNQGEKAIFIDRCSAGAYRTVLLNGSILLTAMGRVRGLSLWAINAAPAMEALVDEWHLVPQQRR
jgi:hypothetical protein